MSVVQRVIKSEFSRNKQHAINVVASLINMLVGALISFFLTPYIVKTIGVEANGFVSLANSFIAYATVASTALNSMAGRFIMMALYRNDEEKVSNLYSSLFWGNIILALSYAVLGIACVLYLEYLIIIPDNLLTDVKGLFSLLFLSSIVLTISSAWSISPYIRNKLYLDSLNSSLQSVIRLLLILVLFAWLPPTVSLVGIASLVAAAIGAYIKLLYKSVLLSEYKAKINNFSWSSIRTLVASGIWNTISSLGNLLTSGMDLLVANIFVGPKAMGMLALAKIMPGFISTLNFTIANVFTPSLIIDYAHSDTKQIVHTINQSSKLISVICSIPLAFLFVYGVEFYKLWQPTQDAWILFVLSTITIFGRVFFTGMQPLFNVFTVVDKVKENSLVTIVNGLIIIVVTLLFVKYTSLGVYAVAGVSVVFCFIKNMVFVIPYSAKYLGLNKYVFFETLRPSLYCTGILCLIGWGMRFVFAADTWGQLILAATLFTIIGFFATVYIVLTRKERSVLFDRLSSFTHSHK